MRGPTDAFSGRMSGDEYTEGWKFLLLLVVVTSPTDRLTDRPTETQETHTHTERGRSTRNGRGTVDKRGQRDRPEERTETEQHTTATEGALCRHHHPRPKEDKQTNKIHTDTHTHTPAVHHTTRRSNQIKSSQIKSTHTRTRTQETHERHTDTQTPEHGEPTQRQRGAKKPVGKIMHTPTHPCPTNTGSVVFRARQVDRRTQRTHT